jgi:tRNA A-37 threonylcarbamoyl transferase component Bud32/tetratricopeptide (TPR) repeat protein
MTLLTTIPPAGSKTLLGGRYEVLAPIGTGAAANVFRVRDERGGVERAAKVLKAGNATNTEILARFEDEFRILRTLHHPHLPEVYDYGWTDDDGRFLVMELVDGEPLDAYFRTHPQDIWAILYELCETLTFIHANNLLHHDVKPGNVLVKRTGAFGREMPLVKLIDFGLTYRRDAGAAVRLVGTPEYVAPEVVRGEATLTRAVDYYSLGVTLFELLCGAPPFVGPARDVLRAHLEREPVIEEEQVEWAELYPHVRALLTKDRRARLEAFEELRRAVVSRLTGGIDELDRAYGMARIDSLGMIGKEDAWRELLGWLEKMSAAEPPPEAHLPRTTTVLGAAGVGKRYLAATLRAEAALHGIQVLTPADLAEVSMVTGQQPVPFWARLLEVLKERAMILLVEHPASLADEERAFVRLAGTRWELARSRGRVLPLFFLIVRDAEASVSDVLEYLPSDAAREVEIPALSARDREAVLAHFRGSMFDSRDARALSTYLGRFDDAEGALQGLQRAVLQSGLTFSGQRWKTQPTVLGETLATHRVGALSQDLVDSFGPVERSVVVVLAVHPDPVPLDWVAEFAGTEPDAVRQVLSGRMKRLCAVSRERAIERATFASSALKEGILATLPDSESRRAREFLIARLELAPRAAEAVDVRNDRALATHYERLGLVRDAARLHVRLLRAHWRTRPRVRSYESIEDVCRSGLGLLLERGAAVSPRSRRHLFCFYLKQWVNALWARNLITQTRGVIDEWTGRFGEPVPSPVAPRYVRAVLDSDGATAALKALEHLKKDGRLLSRQLELRFELERSLCLHMKGEYERALDVLDGMAHISALGTRDLFRLHTYRAMNLDETGETKKARKLLTPLVDRAWGDGCVDESVLMGAIIARSLLADGRMSVSLAEIANGLKRAHAEGLHFRENLLYRLAASVYLELGDIRRLKRCQENALQLAGTLGIRYLTGIGWARLAVSERMDGRFGNALRYTERALSIMGDEGPERDRTQTHLSLYALHVLLRTNGQDNPRHDMARRMRTTRGHNERGFYHCWLGRDLAQQGRVADALKSLHKARDHFELAGYTINAMWAALLEARVHLDKRDRDALTRTMRWVEERMGSAGSESTLFEFRIVKLKEHYLWRRPWSSVAALARQCESSVAREADVYLKIEMLQILFRLYARHGSAEEARQVFGLYRDLVLEVVGNVDSRFSDGVAEAVGLGEMMSEFRELDSVPARS